MRGEQKQLIFMGGKEEQKKRGDCAGQGKKEGGGGGKEEWVEGSGVERGGPLFLLCIGEDLKMFCV